jgi:hypothetical protein
MNYTQLSALLSDTVENSFTADQLALFFQAAEEKIYNVCQPPSIRETQTGAMTIGVSTLALPANFLYPFSFAIVLPSGDYLYLLNKDVNYLREAYPRPSVTGVPSVYALQDESDIVVGPTPNAAYVTKLEYARYPTSITTAGTSWLGDNYPTALLNMAVVEAGKFLKLEQDTMTVYEKQATESLALVKNAGDGKLRQDTYRSGQVRVPVK